MRVDASMVLKKDEFEEMVNHYLKLKGVTIHGKGITGVTAVESSNLEENPDGDIVIYHQIDLQEPPVPQGILMVCEDCGYEISKLEGNPDTCPACGEGLPG